MTTFDEAKVCPKHGGPGESILYKTLPNGGKVYTVFCRKETCEWYNTSWLVQLDRNNEVYQRPRGEKTFPTLTPGQLAAGRRIVEDAIQAEHNHDG